MPPALSSFRSFERSLVMTAEDDLALSDWTFLYAPLSRGIRTDLMDYDELMLRSAYLWRVYGQWLRLGGQGGHANSFIRSTRRFRT